MRRAAGDRRNVIRRTNGFYLKCRPRGWSHRCSEHLLPLFKEPCQRCLSRMGHYSDPCKKLKKGKGYRYAEPASVRRSIYHGGYNSLMSARCIQEKINISTHPLHQSSCQRYISYNYAKKDSKVMLQLQLERSHLGTGMDYVW